MLQLIIHGQYCKYTDTVVVFYKKYKNTNMFVIYNCNLQIFGKITFYSNLNRRINDLNKIFAYV